MEQLHHAALLERTPRTERLTAPRSCRAETPALPLYLASGQQGTLRPYAHQPLVSVLCFWCCAGYKRPAPLVHSPFLCLNLNDSCAFTNHVGQTSAFSLRTVNTLSSNEVQPPAPGKWPSPAWLPAALRLCARHGPESFKFLPGKIQGCQIIYSLFQPKTSHRPITSLFSEHLLTNLGTVNFSLSFWNVQISSTTQEWLSQEATPVISVRRESLSPLTAMKPVSRHRWPNHGTARPARLRLEPHRLFPQGADQPALGFPPTRESLTDYSGPASLNLSWFCSS